MSTERTLRILISGAGIAGLTAAHFLLVAGHEVVVIERATELRASGQNVDVRGHALTVLQRMKNADFDVEEAVRSNMTHEKGLRFVNEANKTRAEFPVGDGTSFTAEIEIMRGDLVNALYNSVRNLKGFEAVFGSSVTQLGEQADGIVVRLESRTGQTTDERKFDLVIATDGITSHTRTLAFGHAGTAGIKSLGQWSCWFSIPYADTDGDWARWYNASKGRMILSRGDNGKASRVSLWIVPRDDDLEKSLAELVDRDVTEQKQFWKDLFETAGWEGPRVLKGLETADDFHMQRVAQVKLDKWSSGRVVLAGDSASCPSPVSGMGVTTAMTGAYVLAGEISSNPTDLAAAAQAYEKKMRPFVKKAQELAPGTPGAANPETAFGIWLLYTFLSFIAWTRVYKLLGSSVNPPSQAMDLPNYAF